MLSPKILVELFACFELDVTEASAARFLKKYPSLSKGGWLSKELFHITWKASIKPKLEAFLAGADDTPKFKLDKETGEIVPM